MYVHIRSLVGNYVTALKYTVKGKRQQYENVSKKFIICQWLFMFVSPTTKKNSGVIYANKFKAINNIMYQN